MKKCCLVFLIVLGLLVGLFSPAFAQVDPSPVPADEIILSAEVLELEVGDTYRLRADILPTNARVTVLKWRSNNDIVATVNQRFSPERATSIGLIRAHSRGEAVITVFVDDGSDDPLTAECLVIVGPRDPATDPSDPVQPIATPPTGGGTLSDNFYLTGLITIIIAFAALTARKFGKRITR